MTRLQTLISALALALWPIEALAQQTTLAFDSLKTDTSAPVQVQADQLVISQSDGTASFSGNVVVTQADMVLQAAEVSVIYAADRKAIIELHATGGVTLKAGENAVSADEAVFRVVEGELVLSGKVLLSQPQATLAGERLSINLKTGLGTMSGRVTTTFNPGGN